MKKPTAKKPDPISRAAAALGRRGGQAKSEAKTRAARENARKPRKKRE